MKGWIMLKIAAGFVILLSPMGFGLGATRRAAEPARGEVPTFRTLGYVLALDKLESRSAIDLADHGKKEHILSMKGTLRLPEGEDAVAVSEKLRITGAIDNLDENILKKPRRKTTRWTPMRKTKESYVAVNDNLAGVEIPQTRLTENPYRLKRLTVEAKVILAIDRASGQYPAVVMARPRELVKPLSVRISSIRISPKRDLSISVQYSRKSAGTAGPFIERISILDENGLEIGGGRWTTGNPFAKTGTLNGRFKLAKNSKAETVRIVAVTRHETRTITFEIEGVFQK